MTLLGKVFTVLIFVMSILFMGFSVVVFATHRNWKSLVDNTDTAKGPLGLKQQLQAQVETNKGLRTELDTLRNQLAVEMAARRSALSAAETKLAEAQQRLSAKEAELAGLQSAQTVATAALNAAETRNKELVVEVMKLRDEIRDAQVKRDEFFQRVVGLTDKLHEAAGLERNLKERERQLIDEINKYKSVTDVLGVNPNMPVETIAPPLDGIVVAVGEKNLIEVSLGSDDGLRVGHRVEVFRDNNYLGSAVVLKTNPDRAVAQVDDKSQRGLIKVRDRVATKLSRNRTT
jgi:regulator of replication initiation timing